MKAMLVSFLALCIVEIVYRFQWIDFYSKEWEFQNPDRTPDAHKTRVLVLGDSFSADSSSWVGKWHKQQDSIQVLNASIPGTGPEVYRLIAANRIEEVKPDVLIIQLYEGNDLYDLRKPVNWGSHSFGRNLYWSAGNVFRSLGFINYRLGQSKADVHTRFDPKKQETFRRNRYDARTRLYIQGDKNYPSAMVQLNGDYASDFEDLMDMLKEIRETAGKKTTCYIVPVPTCVQVHKRYLRHYNWLGATNDPKILEEHRWAKELKAAGFDVIDPTPAFRAAEKRGQRLYYANDPHLNSTGQNILLETIQKVVKP